MCGICGCGDALKRSENRTEATTRGLHRHADGTVHAHDGDQGHEHDRPGESGAEDRAADIGTRTDGASVHTHEMRRIVVERSILAQNESHAEALSARLAAQGIDVIGLVGGPGSGKTTFLEATLHAVGANGAQRHAVVEGDCATDLDARRIAACGARVAQVETGGLCHLDAAHVEAALTRLDLDGVERIFVENVGNLVCPAAFACGEARRVVMVSTAEGDEKPLKYPAVFARADLLLVTKADLLPHLEFDVARCIAGARSVRPDLPALVVSARSGEGIEAWLRWLCER